MWWFCTNSYLDKGVVHARVDQIVTLTSKLDNPEELKLSRGQIRDLLIRQKVGLGEVLVAERARGLPRLTTKSRTYRV